MTEKNVFALGGPTGSGESTITQALIERFPVCARLVTATTRAPRGLEKHGVDYYFFSKEEFERHITTGVIAEYTYIKNRDCYYGSYKPDLDKKIAEGKIVIVNVDAVGVAYYREHYAATAIFLKPESIEEIERRLRSRDVGIAETELTKRLLNAKEEIQNEEHVYDESVINKRDHLQEAVEEVVLILRDSGYTLGE
ncbi:MAG: guanylate kinase [Candidatus Magasanikbacteria bacterium]|jgi:guanylate kinase|nr:guanylate kinase [Candidatus Magasanikbacteria bacterium]MBT5262969.1 guanylate kinase [Candidatus Magasanikbacteria bacterium]MBT5820699.1 guanylate kinase [Candidatus Magasanikbacteria bacterium]MBT6294388.1 guanylate kinase [Candidatus Magasanikbacteria bacterium]